MAAEIMIVRMQSRVLDTASMRPRRMAAEIC